MKLSMYPKLVKEACRRNNIQQADFEIILFGSEREWFSQSELRENLMYSKSTIILSLNRLLEKGLVKIVREHRVGISRRYVITPSSRLIIQWFYIKFNLLQPK